MFPDLIGWLASAVLFATLFRQVWTQIRTRSAAGLSRWLFVGQMTASVLFLAYGLLLRNWVFSVSNGCCRSQRSSGRWFGFAIVMARPLRVNATSVAAAERSLITRAGSTSRNYAMLATVVP
jgi:uncharacterized protein with PQ loop repeat